MANEPDGNKSEEWAALFYLCGHYDRPGEQDPFVAALEDLRKVPPTESMSTAVYLDLESGAQRIAIRAGEVADTEFLGAVNSGDPKTLEQFLSWAFDACPARRYLLVMAGLGIMDSQSVVGRPPFDSERMFAICDDRATDDAIELHELSATLRAAFPDEAPRRLVVLACDMYAMQFMEVAYELRGVLDLLLGIQVDERHDGTPVQHWPYTRLLKKWQEIVAAPVQGAAPRWRSGSDPHTLPLATETVSLLSEHYQAKAGEVPVTVSAINLQALAPLAQALDTFSVVYLQWLSNDVIWRARENVVSRHMDVLKTAWSYDLAEVADAICDALQHAANQALVRWAIASVRSLSYPRLSRVLRALGAAARDLARSVDAPEGCRKLADEIAARRTAIERAIAVATTNSQPAAPPPAELDRAVLGLFANPDDPDQVREPEAWTAIITAARKRMGTAPPRELVDAFDGIDASHQLGRLAKRVSDLARGQAEGEPPAVVALWPASGRCGISLYRPIDLDKLAHSNYLELRFSRELHWTALLTAVDLIKNHARMLWRLLESQLTAAPLEARYQLMRRLAGDQALTGRHAEQLKALSAPNALFLTIEPVDEAVAMPKQAASGESGAAPDAITSYRVRLSSIDRSATAVEHRNQLTRERLENVLEEIDAVGSEVDPQPVRTVQRLARCGSLLGDDVLYGVSERLAEVEPVEKRAVHLVLQMPRELMRYPWELLRDRRGWLIERFAIGRQVIAEGDIAFGWGNPRRHGPLRLLVVAPSITGQGAELAGVGALEGMHVAACFERLQERLPGLVDARNYRKYVDQPVTVDQFRALIRERRFDVVHFAGHGRYDPINPERSCWMFSDGPLYAFELRHTLANASVIPWLLYGSACEAARESTGTLKGGYHDGIYGMASAALGQGVAAYLGPLWKISETDAKNIAAAFYEALLLRRASLGEALALARRSVKVGEPDLDELVTSADASPHHDLEREVPRSAGWTGMVLYGDPTPTVLQRISPSDAGEAAEEK